MYLIMKNFLSGYLYSGFFGLCKIMAKISQAESNIK